MPITDYRQRTLACIKHALQAVGPIEAALDFGSGDGFFCQGLKASGLLRDVTPIDVVERKNSLVRPQLYPGGRLPFADASFNLVYAVDVLHHCPDPVLALDELVRCTRRWLMIKDHNCHGAAGHLTLAVLDELGNRRFGIPSPGLYQRDWAWVTRLEARGFTRQTFVHPMPCHNGLLGALTNNLQFLGLWQRDQGQPADTP